MTEKITSDGPVGFQSFGDKAEPAKVAGRLKSLHAEMERENIDVWLVPRADAHRGEAVPASEARLGWLTGFTGSAGMAAIGLKKAALFVDSRYVLQAPAQTDGKRIDVLETPKAQLWDWLAATFPRGGRIGYDPWLMTPSEIDGLREKLGERLTLQPIDNLVDRIWADRPAPPTGEIEVLGDNRAGKPASAKIAELKEALAANSAAATILTLPESICWLFNIRGRDVPNTPFVLGYAIVKRSGKPALYVDPKKLTATTRAQIDKVATIRNPSQLLADVEKLGATGQKIQIDPASSPVALAAALKRAGAILVEKTDPVLLPKSQKNAAELDGMREAHRLDGIALAKFLSWFDDEARDGSLDEISIVKKLEGFRREEASVIDNSFDCIAGAGANGAIVHYRVTEASNRRLKPGELMLVDSGAQYLSGTTDVTRTLFTGSATDEEKDRYTRVLKGMIAISTLRFPYGTSGGQIDVLARQFLWNRGVTYNHGTGHGVGAFLSVHEGPVGISPRYLTPFEPGMIVSNEPGYYKKGAYGIRIENLIHVIDSEDAPGFLEFETLTLAPIDVRLIDLSLLSEVERAWLNAYHARVHKLIGPYVEGQVGIWLAAATRPI